MKLALDARERAQHKRASDSPHRSAPITVRPITESSEAQCRQESTEQRPAGRQPALQHPANGGAHQPHTKPDAPKWISGNHLSRSQNQSLRGLGIALISGLHENAESLK